MKVLCILCMFATLMATASDHLYVPHLAADQGSFTNQLVLHNRTATAMEARLMTVDSDGIEAEFVVQLGPGERLVSDPDDVWGRRSVTHYRVVRREGLSAGVQIRSAANPDYTAYLPAIEKPSTQWRIHASDWSKSYDGVAIVNASSCFAANLQLILHAADGKQLQIVDVVAPLEGNRKTLYDLSQLFADEENGAYVDIRSEQPLVILGLNGSRNPALDTSYLVGNVAVPISEREDLRAALQAGRARWSDTGFSDSYRFTLQTSCFCTREPEVEVVVRNWRLNAMTRTEEGTELTLGESRDYFTVEELFNLIESKLETAELMKVNFHPEFGYPTNVRIDEKRCISDDEITYGIVDLEGIR